MTDEAVQKKHKYKEKANKLKQTIQDLEKTNLELSDENQGLIQRIQRLEKERANLTKILEKMERNLETVKIDNKDEIQKNEKDHALEVKKLNDIIIYKRKEYQDELKKSQESQHNTISILKKSK